MKLLRKIFGSSKRSPQQAVLAHLDGQSLPASVYSDYDLATIEDRLIDTLNRSGLGEFDGNEIGPTGATMYMYGSDAEKLFASIKDTLQGYPLCQGARVIIRSGGPGSRQREVVIGAV